MKNLIFYAIQYRSGAYIYSAVPHTLSSVSYILSVA